MKETFHHFSDNLGIPSSQQNNEPLILNEMQDSEYGALVQMLNKKQREFFYHPLHLIKTSDKPFYAFLSGGGGVGKSHLIKSIYQAALKYYNSRAGQDFRPDFAEATHMYATRTYFYVIIAHTIPQKMYKLRSFHNVQEKNSFKCIRN